VKAFEAHRSRVTCLKTLPDNRFFASGSFSGSIKLWDSSTFECVQKLYYHVKAVSSLEFRHAMNQLISCSWDKNICVWNLSGDSTACVRVINQAHSSYITCLKVTTSDRLLSSSWDKTVKLWDLDKLESLQTIQTKYPIHKFDSFI
jgi:WD40 repeat protein